MEVFYLKIAKEIGSTWFNVDTWLQAIKAMPNPFVYLVVDNPRMLSYAKEKFDFRNIPHEVITNQRDSVELQTIMKPISQRWYGAGYAHLTTFLHARDHGYKELWNIDADDMVLYASQQKLAELFHEIKRMARCNNIHIFSMDAWRTIWARKNHWTFSVTYTDNESVDWIKVMLEHFEDKEYLSKFLNNIDSYIQYLGKIGVINCRTFYVENLHVIVNYNHDFYRLPAMGLCYWSRGRLIFPMLVNEFGMREFGTFRIDEPETIKIDVGVTVEECQQRLLNEALSRYNVSSTACLRRNVELMRTPPPHTNSIAIFWDYVLRRHEQEKDTFVLEKK